MKFSTGSSSSSLASDSMSRKSTLCIYTDSDFLNGPEKMASPSIAAPSPTTPTQSDDETPALRREIASLNRVLALQRRRSSELQLRLATRDTAATDRVRAADRKFAALQRALFILEAGLRSERAAIQARLKEKDSRLEEQRRLILRLEEQCCAGCRKKIVHSSADTDPEFHSLESGDSNDRELGFDRSMSCHERRTPFVKNSRLSKSFQIGKINNASGGTSSSEEVFEVAKNKSAYVKNKQAFVRKDVTRRSRKFSGRRHGSVYLENVRNGRGNGNGSSGEESGKFHPDGIEDGCCDIGEEISKDIERASNRIDELLNGSICSNEHKSYSVKMDSMHGIGRQNHVSFNSLTCDDTAKEYNGNPWYNNSSDPEPENECQYGDRFSHHRSLSADDILAATQNRGNQKHYRVGIPDENRSGVVNMDMPVSASLNGNNVYQTRSEAGKFESEPNENWYASASDPDDDPSCEIYKNNPVLECVNQILLQNSLDESSCDGARIYEAVSPKASTKRVQFSTLNSISFDESVGNNGQEEGPIDLPRSDPRRGSNKIVKFSLETASEHSYEVPVTSEGFNYEIQSIYSNDYEPIMTKSNEGSLREVNIQKLNLKPIPLPRSINKNNNNSESPKTTSKVKNMAMNLENKINGNHYVDMENKKNAESRPGVANRRKVPRVPPALPPKPKNLVSKFKLNGAANSDTVAPIQRTDDVRGATPKEPDYCSISEVSLPVVRTPSALITSQATVEIHAERLSPGVRKAPAVAKIATVTRIVPNKDIPKLPQVTEIIIPDDDEVKLPAANNSTNEIISPHVINALPSPTQPTVNNSGSKVDLRSSIQMGHSVSTILTDIKNRSVSIEDVNKCILTPEPNRQYPNLSVYKANGILPAVKKADKSRLDLAIFEAVENECEKFDLSQTFEEFKIDDCEEFGATQPEEYSISDGSASDEAQPDARVRPAGPYRIEFTAEDDLARDNAEKNYSKLSNKPDLLSNIENVETDSVRYSDLESSNSSGSNCGSYNTVKEAVKIETKNVVPFEYFLESSGLSSKSILTPSRPPSSNHRNVLRPKDIKTRSRNILTAGKGPLYERCGNTAIKYFEPYL